MNDGRIVIKHIKQDKLKTGGIAVYVCDELSRERAYKNALISYILTRGTEKYPTVKSVAGRLNELYGADLISSVENRGEIQVVQLSSGFVEEKYAPGKNLLKHTAELLLEMLLHPVTENGIFSQSYFDREKHELCEYIMSIKNEKRTYARMRLIQNMCEDEPYGVPAEGFTEDGDNLTNEELYDYYQNYFLKKTRIYVYICSKEEPKEVIDYIRETLSKYDEGSGEYAALTPGYIEKKEIPFENIKHIKEASETMQAQLQIGLRTNTDPGSDENYDTYVMNYLLGGSSESKLFMNVREKNSLAYYAASSYNRFKGAMFIYCGIEYEKYEDALDICIEQINEIRKGNFTDAELESSIKYLTQSVRDIADTVFGQINFSFNCDIRKEAFLDKISTVEEYADKLSRVTREGIIRAAERVRVDTVFLLGGEDE